MKAMKGLHLFMVLTVLVSSTVILVPTANAQTPNDPAADAQTIHYLQVIMEAHPNTGNRHKIDGDRMSGLLAMKVQTMINEKIPTAKVNISELVSGKQGPAITRDSILDWLKGVQPGPDDVVFVYFSGHGGADKTEAKDMFITLSGGKNLHRKDIVEVMDKLGCRLKILITDACSAGPQVEKPDVGVAPPVDLNTALYNLFFQHEGFLNISSASEGEKAAGDSRRGSYFTYSFLTTIFEGVEFEFIDFKPQDGFVSWSEVFERTQEATIALFDKNKENMSPNVLKAMKKAGQTTQTPKYFGELPKRFER